MSRDEKAAVLERLREFDRVADCLDMPLTERLGILNLTEEEYLVLHNALTTQAIGSRPELERRLTYALPLMRRLAGNTVSSPGPGPSRSATRVF